MKEEKNIYVGNRYVPKIMGEWNKQEPYEGLSIVTFEGNSYTSKKRVPIGIEIKNEEYWVITGNYNAQVENYRDEVKKHKEEINKRLNKKSYMPEFKNGVDKSVTIQELYNSVPENSIFQMPQEEIEFYTPLVFDRLVHLDFTGATMIYKGLMGSSFTAIQIGNRSKSISQVEVWGLNEKNIVVDWKSGIVGVRFVNLYSSTIGVGAWNSTSGIIVEGTNGIGNGYNKYFLSNIYNNKKSIILTSSTGGWTNENTFYGGHFGWSSYLTTTDENVHALIEYVDYSNNSNTFYKASFEKAATGGGYAWKIEKGRYNAFRDCRYEGLKKIFIGEGSLYNEITSGYDSTALVIEDNGIGTKIVTPNLVQEFLEGPRKYMNRSSVNDDVHQILSPIDKKMNYRLTGTGEIISQNKGTFFKGINWYSDTTTSRGIYHTDVENANPGSIKALIKGGYDGLEFKVEGTNNNSGWKKVMISHIGNTSQRPSNPYVNQQFTDNTLKKIIWWDGTNWLDAMGNIV